MKHLLYISFLFLSLAAAAQPRYAILKVPQCWTTPTAVDSSVTRHVLIGTQYAAPITLFFTNANEDTVTVSGGSLAFGYCDCCGDGSPGGNNIIAINGLTQTGDTVTFGGVLIYDTQLDLGMYDLEVINGDTAVITGNWVGIVGGDGLKLNSVFFPRNDGFDGQSLVYDAAGDSLKWETITSDNIYNADGRQTDQLRTDTLGGKTLVFDGKTGLSDTSTMIILQADGSSDDAKTTFLRMDTEVLSFRDSLIFYDYDLSFIQRSSSNLEILSDGFTSVGGLNDSLRLQVGFLGPSQGAFFVDDRVTPRGIEYQSQAYRNTFSDSSLVDKGYVDAAIVAATPVGTANRTARFNSAGILQASTLLFDDSTRISINTNGLFKLGPRTAAPGTPQGGDLWYRSDLGNIVGYDGVAATTKTVLWGNYQSSLIPYFGNSSQLQADTFLYYNTSNNTVVFRKTASSGTIPALQVARANAPFPSYSNTFSINFVGGDQFSITAAGQTLNFNGNTIAFQSPVRFNSSNSFRTNNNRPAGYVSEINPNATRIAQWIFGENNSNTTAPFLVTLPSRSQPNGINPNTPGLSVFGAIFSQNLTADTSNAVLTEISISPTFNENSQSGVVSRGIRYEASTPSATHYALTINTGLSGFSTENPTATVDINGSTGYNQLRLRTTYTPTSTADANGNTGDFAWDDSFLYIKTSAGWKRTALSTF